MEYGIKKTYASLATYDGMIRVWPLVTRDRVSEDINPDVLSCRPYDPRTRPWYISASTGNKDVIILVDTSHTMKSANADGDSPLNSVKAALIKLLETFSLGDFINVIAFSDDAMPLYEDVDQPLLSMRNNDSVTELKERIEGLKGEGEGNYTKGFEKAFDLFENALENDQEDHNNTYSSNCTQILILFTDGLISDEDEDVTEIINYVSERQNQLKDTYKRDGVKLFTYTVGDEADDFLTRVLACKNGGAWTHLDINENDILTRMNSYFLYIADGKYEQEPVWTLPYDDDYGLGMLTTSSISFYTSPKPEIK